MLRTKIGGPSSNLKAYLCHGILRGDLMDYTKPKGLARDFLN